MTELEKKVLAAVIECSQRTGFPATSDDVRAALGYASKATAHPHLVSLVRQGVLRHRGKQGYIVA